MHQAFPAVTLLLLWSGAVVADVVDRPGEVLVGPATSDGILTWPPRGLTGEISYTADLLAGPVHAQAG